MKNLSWVFLMSGTQNIPHGAETALSRHQKTINTQNRLASKNISFEFVINQKGIGITLSFRVWTEKISEMDPRTNQ